jgi:hypothetical protein
MVRARRCTYDDHDNVDGRQVDPSVSGVEAYGGNPNKKPRTATEATAGVRAHDSMRRERILPRMGYWCGKVRRKGHTTRCNVAVHNAA